MLAYKSFIQNLYIHTCNFQPVIFTFSVMKFNSRYHAMSWRYMNVIQLLFKYKHFISFYVSFGKFSRGNRLGKFIFDVLCPYLLFEPCEFCLTVLCKSKLWDKNMSKTSAGMYILNSSFPSLSPLLLFKIIQAIIDFMYSFVWYSPKILYSANRIQLLITFWINI